MAADADIRPLDYSPEGRQRTGRLLRAVFPEAPHLDADYLDRLYRGNPVGPTTGFAAHDADGELIGHYLMVPILSRLLGREERGIWPFQLAMHPTRRGKGVFTALVQASLEEMDREGYTHFLGITNAQSTPIYEKRFGYTVVSALDVKIGIGPMPRPDLAQQGDLDYRRVWSREGIAWRCRLPERPYRVTRHGDQGSLWAATGRLGIHVQVGVFPWSELPGLARLAARGPLRMWIGLDGTRDWRRSAYVDLPQRLRASPLNFMFHDLTGQGRLPDARRVRFDVFDFDAY